MWNWLKQFAGDQDGATSIEYALIAAFIAIAIITAVNAIGLDLTNVFNNAATALA